VKYATDKHTNITEMTHFR